MCPRPLLHDLGDEANATRETVEPSDDEFSVFVFGQGKRFSSMRLPALPEAGPERGTPRSKAFATPVLRRFPLDRVR